jgi:hypothetical protein
MEDDLDNILNEYETKKDQEKRRQDEETESLKQAAAAKQATFKKCADEIILPILSKHEATLKGKGYPVKITNPFLTLPGYGAFYERITFDFGTHKSTDDLLCHITFQIAEAPNISITFTDRYTPTETKCEATEFAIQDKLLAFFKKAFRE